MELEEDSVKLSLYVWLSQPGVSLSSPFFDHARTVGEGRGPCVVDMKPERMYEYARGFHHFIADMRGLPLVDAFALEEFVKAQEIREMMAMRDECVNMKKVLLHLQHYAKNLLVQLRRLSICFYAGRNVVRSSFVLIFCFSNYKWMTTYHFLKIKSSNVCAYIYIYIIKICC